MASPFRFPALPVRPALAAALGFLLVASAGADAQPAPKSLQRPQTALARAKAEGAAIAVFVKVVNVESVPKVVTQQVFETVEKVVNGAKVTEKVPMTRTVQFMDHVPKGYREVKLTGADVKARTAAGAAVPAEKLPELLAADTPVLLNTDREPVDPFHLLTTKPGTIILQVEWDKIAPPPPVK